MKGFESGLKIEKGIYRIWTFRNYLEFWILRNKSKSLQLTVLVSRDVKSRAGVYFWLPFLPWRNIRLEIQNWSLLGVFTNREKIKRYSHNTRPEFMYERTFELGSDLLWYTRVVRKNRSNLFFWHNICLHQSQIDSDYVFHGQGRSNLAIPTLGLIPDMK